MLSKSESSSSCEIPSNLVEEVIADSDEQKGVSLFAADLADKVQGGDWQAVLCLLHFFLQDILPRVIKKRFSKSLTPDERHDAYIRTLLIVRDHLRDGGRLATLPIGSDDWLAIVNTIAKCRCLDLLRSKRRRPEVPAGVLGLGSNVFVAATSCDVEYDELRQVILAAIATLTPKLRSVAQVAIEIAEGKGGVRPTSREIAEEFQRRFQTEMTGAAAKQNWHRARAGIRKFLSDNGWKV